MKLLCLFLCALSCLCAERDLRKFEGWRQKPLELIQLFPADRCIYLKSEDRSEEYLNFLEGSNFRLLADWPEGAIFVKGDFFDDFASERALDETWKMMKGNYRRFYVYHPGAMFYIDESPDSIKSILKEGHPWEGNISIIIKKFCKENTVVIDVGAHIGIHTIAMSRKVGPKGAVVAFEPQKKLYVEQLQNLKFNNCKNVISICKAIGEKRQMVQLTPVDPTNEGGTAIGEGGEWVEMIPLDDLHLTNVSLIKMDVENYEYFALVGAKETILRNKPAIIFEVNGSNLDPNPEKEKENLDRITDLIHSVGYEIYQMYHKDYIALPAGVDLGLNLTDLREKKDYLRPLSSP